MTTYTPALPLPRKVDRTRTAEARDRALTRRMARAARKPMPLDLDRLSAELHDDWGMAR